MAAHVGSRRRRSMRAAVACALTLASVTGVARGQQIISVQGIDGLPQGVLGTKLYIQGKDFGEHKPKVTLTDPATGKVYKLKVIQHGDSYVYARIKKAVAGDLQLALFPKGADEPVLAPAPLTIPAPTLKLLTDAPALGQLWPGLAGLTTTVLGTNFGGGKLQVRVAGKPAKVYYPTDHSLTVRIPKKTPPGEQLLELSNGVGTCSAPIWIQPGPKHTDVLDTSQVSLQLEVEGVSLTMQVTQAKLGSTASLASGEARPFLIIGATEPVSELKLILLVHLGDGAVAPAVLAAPFVPLAGEADVQFWVGLQAGADAPWNPGESSPQPLQSWKPIAPFTIGLAQLDPQQHTAQVEFGGPLIGQWTPVESISVVGSISIAP